MPLDPRPPLSLRQLADRWDCSEGLVRKMIERGELHSFRIGVLIRIPAVEVDRFEGNAPSAGPEIDPMEIWEDDD